MAQPRRISLCSASLVVNKELDTNFANLVADGNKDLYTNKEHVIESCTVFFDVQEPTEEFCPHYDFEKLLLEQSNTGEEEEFSDDNDSDLEVKVTQTRSLVRLGKGYDHTDPWVDDAESKESQIPQKCTTQHGGFYIGAGPLLIRRFQQDEEESHVYKTVKANECVGGKQTHHVSKRQPDAKGKADKPKRRPTPNVGDREKEDIGETQSIAAADGVSELTEEPPEDLGSPKNAISSLTLAIPMGVSDTVHGLITNLKDRNRMWFGSKTGFFSSNDSQPTNADILLRLTRECRKLQEKLRSDVFGSVAECLSMKKQTLRNRANRLLKIDVATQLKAVLDSLQRELESNSAGKISEAVNQLGPVFKQLIGQAVHLKMTMFGFGKKGVKTTSAEYIRGFVEDSILPLWKNRPVDRDMIASEALAFLSSADKQPEKSIPSTDIIPKVASALPTVACESVPSSVKIPSFLVKHARKPRVRKPKPPMINLSVSVLYPCSTRTNEQETDAVLSLKLPGSANGNRQENGFAPNSARTKRALSFSEDDTNTVNDQASQNVGYHRTPSPPSENNSGIQALFADHPQPAAPPKRRQPKSKKLTGVPASQILPKSWGSGE